MMKDKYMANQLDGEEFAVNIEMKDVCSTLDTMISVNIADCREKTIALEKLEECAMWATKAVAVHGVKR